MNQCLDNPAIEGVSSVRDSPASGAEADAPLAAAGAAASEKGRVLLLERNPAFRQAIMDCLTENGYTVVIARDSKEGLQQVLKRDFALVLYDPMIAGLPCDLFCKAVNRVDRELAGRFVFMTGDDNDDRSIDSIVRIDGAVLRKPFEMESLLAWISFAQACGTFERGSKTPPEAPVAAKSRLPGEEFPEGEVPIPEVSNPAREACPITEPCGETPDSKRDASIPCADADSPVPPETAAASEKGRILLLEEDASFREILRAGLTANGYAVVAVGNGRKGLKEVMTKDFALVLYDPMTAGLPGHMFYSAVNRVDPHLCERFVFMTGDHTDEGTAAFIKNVDATVLQKPFGVETLLDLIAFAKARGTFERVLKVRPCDTVLAETSAPGEKSLADRGPLPEVSTIFAKVPLPRAPVRVMPMRRRPAIALPRSEVQHPKKDRFRVFAGVFLLVLLASLLKPYLEARNRLAAASTKRAALGTEWTEISRRLEEAISLRSSLDAAGMRRTRISAFLMKERWTPVLASLIPKDDAMIEILEIEARGETAESSAWEAHIHGLAGGSAPRVTADRFRLAVERDLKAQGTRRAVQTRFERLEDPEGTVPDQRKLEFIMIAKLEPMEPKVEAPKEER